MTLTSAAEGILYKLLNPAREHIHLFHKYFPNLIRKLFFRPQLTKKTFFSTVGADLGCVDFFRALFGAARSR